MKDFTDSLKLGNIGEGIVDRILKEKGFSIYGPVFSQGSNLVDRISLTPKGKLIFFETKTYARRWAKADQGIDLNDFTKYSATVKNNPASRFIIFFVDAFEQKVLLLDFAKYLHLGKVEGRKVYFQLSLLRPIHNLTSAELSEIGWRPTPEYRTVNRYFG